MFIHAPLFGQETPVEIRSDLERVTVFLNGAQLYRTASADLPAGRSILRFTGLDPYLNPESIQLNAPGITILSVSHHRNFLTDAPQSEQVSSIREVLSVKADSVEIEKMMMGIYDREEAMLVANQSIGGTATGVELGRLESTANFFRTRLIEIKETRRSHQRRLVQLEREIDALEKQLAGLSAASAPAPSSEIEVLLERSSAGATDFALNYVTSRARWQPVYDLRVSDVTQPLVLHYRASLEQFTGENLGKRAALRFRLPTRRNEP